MSTISSVIEMSMVQDLQHLNVISQNIANVSTVGYKRDVSLQSHFESEFLKATSQSVAVKGLPNLKQAVDLVSDMSQGTLRSTENALDIAIEGDAFLEVMTAQGRFFTRQGNLRVDADGRLVTASGYAVAGVDGDIVLSPGTIQIKDNGQIWIGTEYRGQIKLVRFDETDTPKKVGEGLFHSSVQPRVVNDAAEVRVRQGHLETSNVDPMKEMVKLIELTRHFESVQKALSAYDLMMDSAIKSIGEI